MPVGTMVTGILPKPPLSSTTISFWRSSLALSLLTSLRDSNGRKNSASGEVTLGQSTKGFFK